MNKLIILILIITCYINTYAYAFDSYNPNPLNLDTVEYERVIVGEYAQAVQNLSSFEIVRPYDQWDNEDLIKRRDAFEMCHMVYNEGERTLCTYDELNEYEKVVKDDIFNKFADIEFQSYDCALMIALLNDNLLFRGKINESNKLTASFNDNLTYGEALTLIVRLLGEDIRYRYLIQKGTDDYSNNPYYDILKNMGLINSNTPVSYSSLTVDPAKLNEAITAYEFIFLLNNAMYVPHLASSDFGSREFGYRYINNATNNSWLSDREGFVCIP